MKNSCAVALVFILPTLVAIGGCSSGPEVKRQAYAQQKTSREFEEEKPVVWKAIRAVFSKYKLEENNDKELKTDWVYATSNDKYIEYKVNGFPRRKYLNVRHRFNVEVEPRLERVNVAVNMDEEIERLKEDGSSNGWENVDTADSSRAADFLDKIQTEIHTQRDRTQ